LRFLLHLVVMMVMIVMFVLVFAVRMLIVRWLCLGSKSCPG
jgi:hypothetical protein